jgi:leader peptidase (prepilin peptidase)/N-methyltransferase
MSAPRRQQTKRQGATNQEARTTVHVHAQTIVLALLYIVSGWHFVGSWPPPPLLILMVALATLLIAASLVDIRQQRLPDAINAGILALGLGMATLGGAESAAWSALAALAGFATFYLLGLAYQRWRGVSGLGLGDAKLLGAAGSLVGLAGLPSVVLIAAAGALLWTLLLTLAGRPMARDERIAFGPFLALGLWIVWLHGPLSW